MKNGVIRIKKFLIKIKDKNKMKLLIADLILVISFFIIFFTTFDLNKHIAMYLLAIGLFLLSYFIQKDR
ncbi:hypothetical protein DWV40_06110 [Paraclostridium sordellii]|nr:hypothetical protein DWV40_06110 [Paeniclostridium sordellii]